MLKWQIFTVCAFIVSIMIVVPHAQQQDNDSWPDIINDDPVFRMGQFL
jgi:hypothetical protein